jgi:hypothetical protein
MGGSSDEKIVGVLITNQEWVVNRRGLARIRLIRFAVEVGMIRWIDVIGLAGFGMVIVSTLLLFPGSAEPMNWKHWLAGLALWFLGFNSVVGWLLLRWSRQSKNGPAPLLVWSVGDSKAKGASQVKGSHFRNKKTA